MYNNDVYNIIIEESHHIQDAISHGGGGGSGHDYSNVLARIESDVDNNNTIMRSTYFNRISIIPLTATQYEQGTDIDIAHLFNLPGDGSTEERFFQCSLFAYRGSVSSHTRADEGCIINVKDSNENMFTISDHGTFSFPNPVSYNILTHVFLGNFASVLSSDSLILGVFKYSSNVM